MLNLYDLNVRQVDQSTQENRFNLSVCMRKACCLSGESASSYHSGAHVNISIFFFFSRSCVQAKVINPHNTVWGHFDPGRSFQCTAQKPSASQF